MVKFSISRFLPDAELLGATLRDNDVTAWNPLHIGTVGDQAFFALSANIVQEKSQSFITKYDFLAESRKSSRYFSYVST